GGAHGNDAATGSAGGVNLGQGGGGDVVALGVHDVLADIVHAHRLERACTYVQGHKGLVHALLAQGGQHVVGKVQASRRGSHGTGMASVNSLVARVVFFVRCVGNVGWQRRCA